MLKIGTRLKGIRLSKNISVEKIANDIGVDSSTYRRYEQDKTSPSLERIYEIAKALEVEITDLLNIKPVQANFNQVGGVAIALNETLNVISEKLIEKYEEQINDLKKRLSKYEL